MSDIPDRNRADPATEQQAASWLLRWDRGLTPDEQDEFFQWLAADPRHGAELARHRRHWQRLDRLAQWAPEHSVRPNPDLLAPAPWWRVRRLLPVALPLAAAAALAVVFFAWKPEVSETVPTVAASSSQRVMEDGSTIELNRGAEVSVHYSAGERRVRIERGEAFFRVTKDPARPFIVTAAGVAVRAVGTAFNVRMDAAVVEVLVTQGQVALDSDREGLPDALAQTAPAPGPSPVPLLEANQRAVISLAPNSEPPQIDKLMPGEIERVLSWQHRLLNFTDTPLSEVVAEFNRRNTVQLVVIDSELASVRVTVAFRSDNIEGFLHLLEAGFGASVERRGESEILVRRRSASPDSSR